MNLQERQPEKRTVSPADRRAFAKLCFEDRRYFIERFLQIQTRDQRIIPLHFNEAQEQFLLQVEAQEALDKPVRGIGLKPRRVGLSTIIQAIMFHTGATHCNMNGLTVAHDLDSTQQMFRMAGLFYDRLPPFAKPMKRLSNMRELLFENPNEMERAYDPGLRSQLRTATADDENLGRSKEVSLLHCSEVAFWNNADATMLAVSNSVADLPGTMIFKESTPNGVGNYFHKEYKEAAAGKSDYFAFFMPWFDFQAYRKPIEGPLHEFVASVDDEETKLLEKYNLNHEQLNWRRWCIRENCGRDVDKFNQEYPSNDVDCFLLSGGGFFSAKMIKDMMLLVEEPKFQGELMETEKHILGVLPVQDPKGPLRIWRLPALGKRYVIGADVSEGLPSGDYEGGHVYDWDTGDMCAEWHGHFGTKDCATGLARLGAFYGKALLAVEDNNHGHAVNQFLKNVLGYSNLYWHQPNPEDRQKKKVAKLGWQTTSATRPQMLDDLKQACLDGCDIPSKETIDEMSTFVRDEQGRPDAQGGCHDDRIIMSAIAQAVRKRGGLNTMFPNLK